MDSGAPQTGEIRMTDEALVKLGHLMRRQDVPLWRNYPLLVSVAAFLLSLITASMSAYTSYRKDIHDQQAQLASAMQTLADLSVRAAEADEKYKNTPYDGVISNLITSQANTVLHTARELAASLGANATTAELITIASMSSGTTQDLRLIETALAISRNANDESIALRMLGSIEARNAASIEARRAAEDKFKQALVLETKYPELLKNAYSLSFLKASAEYAWADAIAPYDCPAAQVHFVQAWRHMAQAFRTPEIGQMERAAQTRTRSGIGGVPNCLPISDAKLNGG